MGQRSQIIVNLPATPMSGPATRVARHYQWVWGGFLIARVAQLVEFLDTNFEGGTYLRDLNVGIPAVYGVNFRTGDVQGLHPYDDVSQYAMQSMDNNDGWVIVDITADTDTDEMHGYGASYRIGIVNNDGRLVSPEEYVEEYRYEEFDADFPDCATDLATIAGMKHGTWFDSTDQAVAAADALLPVAAK